MSDENEETRIGPTVAAKMHEAYDLNLKFNLLPAREIPRTLRPACQPRQGAQRVDKGPVELPEPTREWLLDANKRVIAWLAREEKNQLAFLADPMGALQQAGVAMDRTHAKALARARESFGMAQAVVPGLQLRSIRAKVSKTGRVKRVDGIGSDWKPPELRQDNDDDTE